MEIFLGKSQVREMNMFSGAFDTSVFNGNTIYLKKGEECSEHRYLYIAGKMVCSFLTSDNFYEYILNMGINLTPFSIAVGDGNIYFLTPHFKFIRRDKINYDYLLSRNENFVDPYDYHLSNCGKVSFEKLRFFRIHSNYDDNK